MLVHVGELAISGILQSLPLQDGDPKVTANSTRR